MMICFLFFFLFLKATFGGDWASEFAYNTYLDSNQQYHLFWTVLDDDYIEIGIQCNSGGWVGFGVSEDGFMTNSDIAFAWIDNNGTAYLQDRHVRDEHTIPIMDELQNLELVEAYKIGNVTSIRFIRPIHSCDPNDTEILDGSTYIIYSWNNDNIPDVNDFDNTVVWHGDNRGSNSVYLLSGTTFNVTLESNTKTFDVAMSNYTIPSQQTTYYCKLIELPKLKNTNQITKFAPIITTGNEDIVHHMLIYSCPASLSSGEVGTEKPCQEYQSSSLSSAACIFGTVVFGWAVGADAFTLPKDVGFDISGDSDLQYVILEVHYNNLEHVANVSDSSGIRIYYTPSLREYNASTIEMGLMVNGYSQFLPPGASSLVNYGYCPSKCTRSGISYSNGTNIFATFLHSHIHGIAMSLRQIRDGIELPRIDSNWHYDFDYQATTAHTQTIKLMPNDTLILECYYQTADSNHTITSGLATTNEMCLVFIYVYPPIQLANCLSSHSSYEVEKWRAIAYRDGYYRNNIYDLSLNGSMEWYETLWNNYTNRIMACIDQEGSSLLKHSRATFLTENEYIVYNDTTPCISGVPNVTIPVTSASTNYIIKKPKGVINI